MQMIHLIEIGSWDMSSQAQKDVAHGVRDILELLPRIGVTIRNDAGDLYYGACLDDTAMPEGLIVVSITESCISIRQRTGGKFDNCCFNRNDINRGHIKIST